MNKRSAMTVAAGLVLAMIVAGVALATGITGPDPSPGTTVAVPAQNQDPIIHTVTRTIEVHETGEPTQVGQAPVLVRSSDDGEAQPDPNVVQGDPYEDGEYEDGEYEDEEYEDEEYEGEENDDEGEEHDDD